MTDTIGIDIGGTHIRLSIVDNRGHCLGIKKFPIGTKRNPQHILSALVTQIKNTIKNKKTITGIGIGVPGIVNTQKGIVYASPHFPDWKNFAIAKTLSKKISLPVTIDNDTNLIALGEARFGSAKKWDSFLMVALGTGIGGCIVINKKIFHGTRGFAGEFGHLNLEKNGVPCGCGSRGCFETLVSSSALIRQLKDLPDKTISPGLRRLKQRTTQNDSAVGKELADLARAKDKAAVQLYQNMGKNLGHGLASLINVTGIEKVVLGGGLAQAHNLFLAEAKQELKKRIYAETAKNIELKLAQLGDEAGILGAAFAALEAESKRS